MKKYTWDIATFVLILVYAALRQNTPVSLKPILDVLAITWIVFFVFKLILNRINKKL